MNIIRKKLKEQTKGESRNQENIIKEDKRSCRGNKKKIKNTMTVKILMSPKIIFSGQNRQDH